MNILLVDDDSDVRNSLGNFLNKLGHNVVSAINGLDGLREFHSQSFELVITDIRMPEMDGLELIRRIKYIERSPADVIIITGHGDMDNAIKALKVGAFDYLQKPINVRELAITIERSSEYRDLQNRYRSLKEEFHERVALETQEFRGMAERLREAYINEIGLGKICVYSEAMRQVINLAEKYSTDRSMPVLIEGETGTGKELVARYIHLYAQANTVTPFVAINCGAISPELFEGELFGHEQGAYTGATVKGQMGKLEAANTGSIFLDEIGEIPINLQVKLLRVLEERKLYRLGGIKEIPFDVRIISATNKNLDEEVISKRFRLDLFYRINMGHIRIPALRERKEDILPLARRFVSQSSAHRGRQFGRFTDAAEDFLTSYPWPGNIRQLKNVMERLALMGPWNEVNLSDLQFIKDSTLAKNLNYGTNTILGQDAFDIPENGLDLEGLNRNIIVKALDKNKNNQTKTANYLGISRRVLQGKLKQLRLLE